MNETKWDTIESCAYMERIRPVPVGLIVDSPWIPGYAEISTLDYYTIPERWLEANIRIQEDFPEVIFLPGFWVEMGMAAEPSGFGCRVSFYETNTPGVHPLVHSPEEVDRITPPHPQRDGLMPLILNIYRWMEQRVIDRGYLIKVVAARGPLAVASFLMGVTEFLVGLKIDPEKTHRLLQKTAATARNWLEAQAEVLREVEGVMLLDDIVGFLSPGDYLEFGHPYLKQIFSAFPQAIKILHNDTDNPTCYPYLEEVGVNIFNFTHQLDIGAAREKVGGKVCLMGNISPLDVLGDGRPEEVDRQALHCLASFSGQGGLILSAGGGLSPGTPAENIRALVSAAKSP